MQIFNGLFACCLFVLTSSAPQYLWKDYPFPPIRTDIPPPQEGTPVFVFDGIDYDELPEKLRRKHNDCYEHYFKCIRNRNIFNVVCTYDWRTGEWGNYYSQCEVEVQNCHYRYHSGRPITGTNIDNDVVFYSGEGQDCSESMNKYPRRRKDFVSI